MASPLSYGQCLREIMKAHHISVQELARKMGYRSATSLVRILKDQTSVSSIERFHRQFRLLFNWLLPPVDIQRLSDSLRYTQLGADGYQLHCAMERLIFQSDLTPDHYPALLSYSPALGSLLPHASAPFSSLDQLIQFYSCTSGVEILMINTQMQEICSAFSRLVRFSKKARTIRHFFVLQDEPSFASNCIASILPLLSENAYEGYYCLPSNQKPYDFLRQHSLIVVRFATEAGEVRTHVLVPTAQGQLSICSLPGSELFDFCSALTAQLMAHLCPIKSSVMPEADAQGMLELSERYLLEESGRSFCALEPDLCLACVHTDILIDALHDGTGLHLVPGNPLHSRLVEIHNARFENMHHKTPPTYFVHSQQAMLRFARTGHLSDHLFGMRDFTPEERIRILTQILQSCRENPAFHMRFLQEESRLSEYEFISFGDLGVQISSAYTDYHAACHREALITLSSFTQAFEDYYMHTLLPNHCLSEEASLAFLQSLIDGLNAQA